MKKCVDHITDMEWAANGIHRVPYAYEVNLRVVDLSAHPKFCHRLRSEPLYVFGALPVEHAPKPSSITSTIRAIGDGYFRPHGIGGRHEAPVQDPAFRDQTD